MSSPQVKPLQIAILINTPPGNQFWHDVRQAYHDAFTTVSPDATIHFYDPVVEGKFPDAARYDLIVLTGGKADASSSDPWVLGVVEYVRVTVQEHPRTKILGICWGHQAVQRAMGGVVGTLLGGSIAAIQDIKLTDAGAKFFPFAASTGSYRAPKFHVRYVRQPGKEFIHLAENHEAFVNKSNTVLSLQAHPEIQKDLAKKMLLEEDKVYNGSSSEAQLQEEVRKLDQPLDGLKVLERVIQWARE